MKVAAVMTDGAFNRTKLEEAGIYEDCAGLLEVRFLEELNPTA